MNQILVSKKIYDTPGIRRKKLIYKIQFVLSVVVVVVLSSYYAYSEYNIRKAEKMSQELLQGTHFSNDNTIVEDDQLVIALNDDATEIPQEVVTEKKKNANVYTAASGAQYTIDSVLNIPSLGINYPVLSDTSDELLKISLNKFWGCEPNEVGNYCIVGHNYDGKDILFGKLNRIKNGDIVELEDPSGRTLSYKVYNIFIVEPSDVACTSQLTNGKKEMTLITCAEGGRRRLIVKCRAV